MVQSYFNRQVKVTIGDRTVEYPPLSIEFENRQALLKFSTTTVRIYNPNDDTLSKAEIKTVGETKVKPEVRIVAGFVDETQESITGVVDKFVVKREGVDRILEMELTDNVLWRDDEVADSFRNQTARVILFSLAENRGDKTIDIPDAENKTYERLVVTDPIKTVQRIAVDTNSTWFVRNGDLNVIPATLLPNDREIILVDQTTGLLDMPKRYTEEKPGKQSTPQEGYVLRTLFLPTVGVGSSVTFPVNDRGDLSQGVVAQAKKSFSTFGDAECEYKVKV